MFDDDSFTEIADHKKGYNAAKDDVTSDAGWGALRTPQEYKHHYQDRLAHGQITKAFYEGCLEGLDAGFKEAL